MTWIHWWDGTPCSDGPWEFAHGTYWCPTGREVVRPSPSATTPDEPTDSLPDARGHPNPIKSNPER